jgi:DNA-binding NarL/FixJ family response regulator
VEPIRVIVADDHTLFREGLRALLASVADVEVVGEAATGAEVVALAESLLPDIILMDLQMPGMNGIEATRHILGTSPHIGVIVLTMFEDDDSVFAAMRAGARGYLLKGADQAEVVRALRAVSNGEALFSPAIALRLVDYFSHLRSPGEGALFPELTERERQVLDLIAQGGNNAEIATRLTLSPKTVRNHVSNILSKLQVVDRSQAIVRARQAGMGQERPRAG